MTTPRIRLVTRGDDAGSCHSANRAILEACDKGILRNASVMVPGPAFEAAAAMFADTGICLGLHVTLNAEWETVKWGPVLPVEQVPSLVDEHGHFFNSPRALHERNPDVDQMVAEVQAQLERARQYGLPVSYLDEHMGVGRLPGLRERLAALAQREGLVDAHPIPSLPHVADAPGDQVDKWIARLAHAAPGTYVLVTHPGYDEDDMRQLWHSPQKPGEVARERDGERRAWLDPRLKQACLDNEVEIVRYTDVLTVAQHAA